MATEIKRFKKDHEISMESPINKLPEEVLLKVFEFLGGKTLKDSALVCKKWDKIIGSSVTTMKKFKLRMNLPEKRDYEEILSLERNHVSMGIHLLSGKAERTPEVIERFGAHLQFLEVFWLKCSTESLTVFLQNLPRIKELKLYNTVMDDETPEQISPVNMPHLTTLELGAVDWDIFRFIYAPRLKSLDIDCFGDFEVSIFTNFLKSTTKLENLNCQGTTYIQESFAKSEGGFPFKLKQFSICNMNSPGLSRGIEEGIGKFLLSQSSSLEEIGFQCTARKDFELILTKLKCLRIWREFDLAALPSDEEFYISLRPTAIREIDAAESNPSQDVLQRVLRICPDLEVLDIREDILHDILPFLSLNNPKMKSLKLGHLGPLEPRFANLKALSMTSAVDVNHLSSFLQNNPTIERLEIEVESRDGEDVVVGDYNFLNEFNIKHLELEGTVQKLKEIYDHIKANPRTIETLKLTWLIREGFNIYISLEFTFPEDQTKWNENHKFFDEGALQRIRRLQGNSARS